MILGLAAARRFEWRDCVGYVVTQVVAAVAAATVLWLVANGQAGFSASESGFATNGYGDRSPAGYSLLAGLVIEVVEVVLTAVFRFIILGVTDTRAPKGFAPLAFRLGLTLIHLVSIPVTNTSVNPACSAGPALFEGGDALAQLWLFIAAPLVGAHSRPSRPPGAGSSRSCGRLTACGRRASATRSTRHRPRARCSRWASSPARR